MCAYGGGSVRNLRILPKVRDSWTYLYAEHARIDQEDKGICLHDGNGRTHVPCASLSLLMLGPGTSITHAAVATLAEAGCLVAWVGEQAVRFYAQGLGETRSAANLLRQASLWADPNERMRIVRRMYEMRFQEEVPPQPFSAPSAGQGRSPSTGCVRLGRQEVWRRVDGPALPA